ncbi:YbfB/YjiJ family MFS transporter [Neptunomonas phycophila]|uniref:YbfB/YjiJ family MFS transporter n=2 Tax=Neptunomonas phycophila TaxID=1572645 RepID=A0ABT9EQN8_9GAMM|nr:YbfB/YjiJ family MFS transporter [Neptunomonas phycophila]MDO6467009.1 YbfB/YjiJ family MFS transporter [Neptunomonas phycophila]MDP2521370.1 YbfB/YjiJ family MFS transporter [Neptunomonas phycophila]
MTNNNKIQHQKYYVLAAGVISLVVLLGIARFAYTPLIPVMISASVMSDISAGWLATLNYAGYLCGAVLAATIGDLMLKDKLYRAGLITAIITTLAMAFTDNVYLWAFMRFMSGLSSAAGLLIGSGLVLNWLIRNNYRSELGIHFMGMGLGIVFTAIACELMVNQLTWSTQWIVLGVCAALLSIPAWRWLPRPHNGTVHSSGQVLKDKPPSARFFWLMVMSYFCAGFGYVISATFTVAMVERLPGLAGEGQLVWLLLGLTAIPAVIYWDKLARRIGTLYTLLICYLIHIIGIVLPLFSQTLTAAIVSGMLYGATFIGIVGLVLTMAGRFYPTKPAKLMGKLTLSYGVAQIIAPAIAGYMAAQTGQYSAALFMAAIMMVLGTILLLILIYTERHDLKALDA